jgi:hypothetical protein
MSYNEGVPMWYVLWCPLGRVIGVSINSYSRAIYDAEGDIPPNILENLLMQMENKGEARIHGYMLRRIPLNLTANRSEVLPTLEKVVMTWYEDGPSPTKTYEDVYALCAQIREAFPYIGRE